ncbi:DUF4190 domain-containing protein [Streptomyces sp. RS10V-4]|uniref:DUF4190 domain-containing protein n=1 Tax=Streptomyces rhizoryzae TaxID=2932493 RepID=UPI0020058C54|nr:DUF4190 domain-containing protein [Streptomyces rhizoryzae]MCK7627457.1 DUF4190 domain-containing protein [Streptomyces rhizoryzae]
MTALTHHTTQTTHETHKSPEAHETPKSPETHKTHNSPEDASGAPRSPRSARSRGSQADGMAVASFVLGLVGTLVLNIVLGPCALVLGGLALSRGTTRRGRALLGLALGAADLLLLVALTTADSTLSWHIG